MVQVRPGDGVQGGAGKVPQQAFPKLVDALGAGSPSPPESSGPGQPAGSAKHRKPTSAPFGAEAQFPGAAP